MAGKTTPLGVAARIAGAQHGVVARRQLVRAGLTSSAIEHMLAAGRLLPLYRGVYAVGHRSVGPRSREMAVVLLAGPTSALACESSAGLWAMTRPWHGPVHALGPKSRSGPGFVHPPHAQPAARGRDRALGDPGHHTPPDPAGPLPHALPRCPGHRAGRGTRPQARHARATRTPGDRQAQSAAEHRRPNQITPRARPAKAAQRAWPAPTHQQRLRVRLPSTTGEPSRPTASATSCSPPRATARSASPTASSPCNASESAQRRQALLTSYRSAV